VHGAAKDHSGGHALEPESADEGGGLPVPVLIMRWMSPRMADDAARQRFTRTLEE
jgi:hypothetical protein